MITPSIVMPPTPDPMRERLREAAAKSRAVVAEIDRRLGTRIPTIKEQ